MWCGCSRMLLIPKAVKDSQSFLRCHRSSRCYYSLYKIYSIIAAFIANTAASFTDIYVLSSPYLVCCSIKLYSCRMHRTTSGRLQPPPSLHPRHSIGQIQCRSFQHHQRARAVANTVNFAKAQFATTDASLSATLPHHLQCWHCFGYR